MALQIAKILTRNSMKKSLKFGPQLISKRNTTSDYNNKNCGKREYVGFGINGSPVYCDLLEYPMPAIRFREPTPEICELRKKEQDDWKNLTQDEIKKLYRYSFCQTFSEMKAPTGEWKLHVGVFFWTFAASIIITYLFNITNKELPPTFAEDRRQAQLKRMIALEINPIEGLSSKWDYEVGDWK